jgi:hypothetical protein
VGLRKALRRLRRCSGPAPVTSTEPVWTVPAASGGAIGCRFCSILRDLLALPQNADQQAYDELWMRGECFATVSGLPHLRIEAGEEFSLFRLMGTADAPALWFRNEDMGGV